MRRAGSRRSGERRDLPRWRGDGSSGGKGRRGGAFRHLLHHLLRHPLPRAGTMHGCVGRAACEGGLAPRRPAPQHVGERVASREASPSVRRVARAGRPPVTMRRVVTTGWPEHVAAVQRARRSDACHGRVTALAPVPEAAGRARANEETLASMRGVVASALRALLVVGALYFQRWRREGSASVEGDVGRRP